MACRHTKAGPTIAPKAYMRYTSTWQVCKHAARYDESKCPNNNMMNELYNIVSKK